MARLAKRQPKSGPAGRPAPFSHHMNIPQEDKDKAEKALNDMSKMFEKL